MEQLNVFLYGMYLTATDTKVVAAVLVATIFVAVRHYWGVVTLRLIAWRARRQMAKDRWNQEQQELSDEIYEFIERKIEAGTWDKRSRHTWYALLAKAGFQDFKLQKRPNYKLFREAQLKAAIGRRLDRGVHRPVKLPDAVAPVMKESSTSAFWLVFQKKN